MSQHPLLGPQCGRMTPPGYSDETPEVRTPHAASFSFLACRTQSYAHARGKEGAGAGKGVGAGRGGLKTDAKGTCGLYADLLLRLELLQQLRDRRKVGIPKVVRKVDLPSERERGAVGG
jgi:hypothetical protein